MRVLVLSHEDVVRALPPAECADAMASVLAAHARGEAYMPLRSMMMPPGAAGFMGLMPAWRGGTAPVFSLKTVCVMPENPARGLDAHQGAVTLYDGETGMPTAILDASAITEIRTAAVSALATRLLAREDARILGIIGAGVQAAAHLHALRLVRDFDRVRVYSPTREHAERLGVEVAPSARDAVHDADVVVTATNAREPVLERAWLADGAHVNAVGASQPASRELDTATVAAAALFCDSRESLEHEAGEYRLAIDEGRIDPAAHVRAELGEVAAGLHPGRTSPRELTLFRSLGLGIEDLAAAELAVDNARTLGLGTEVEL
jgi:ornithine cyclodeaminase/alanine dehydrogenase-like protein (mu-crystallin family)